MQYTEPQTLSTQAPPAFSHVNRQQSVTSTLELSFRIAFSASNRDRVNLNALNGSPASKDGIDGMGKQVHMPKCLQIAGYSNAHFQYVCR